MCSDELRRNRTRRNRWHRARAIPMSLMKTSRNRVEHRSVRSPRNCRESIFENASFQAPTMIPNPVDRRNPTGIVAKVDANAPTWPTIRVSDTIHRHRSIRSGDRPPEAVIPIGNGRASIRKVSNLLETEKSNGLLSHSYAEPNTNTEQHQENSDLSYMPITRVGQPRSE